MNSIKYFKVILTCFVLSFVFLSCGDSDANNIDFTVYPGERVNDIAIGDLGRKIVDRLGSNNVEISSSLGNGDALFQVSYNKHGIQFIMEVGPETGGFESLKINTIKFYGSFSGMTTDNISIGSPLLDVEAAYGLANVDFWGTHSYDDIGIFLDYDDNDLVETFTIYK